MPSKLQKKPQSIIANLSRTASFWYLKPLGNQYFHVLLLAIVVWSLFGRTLRSYFLADDFAEINYVHQIFHGASHLLWSNFTGPYMQNPTILVYRPWELVTQVIDYFFWGPNPFGFFLSNLIYFTADVILVYLVVRTLTSCWPIWRSCGASLSGALLFATNPLHCESISWMVGRVDVDCCFYFLSSLYLFLRSRATKSIFYIFGGVISYFLALFVKEMAIGLPLLVTTIGFLWPHHEQSGQELKLKARLSYAWVFSQPLWLSTVVYFVLRYLALGTVVGGYTGGLEANQINGMLSRWSDPDTIWRLFFPFSQAIYAQGSIYSQLLTISYIVLIAAITVKALSNKLSPSWLLLMLVWIISAIMPIYRLWGLGYNLEGARFYFFLSIPLSLFWPVFVFGTSDKPACTNKPPDLGPALENKLVFACSLALLLMIGVFFRTTYATNLLWVHAGQEVRNLSKRCQQLANILPPQGKIMLLGIPKDHGGAHMILNCHTFRLMLSPPFTQQAVADKFLLFDPLFFGGSQYLNASHFKQCLLDTHVAGPMVWDSLRQDFMSINLTDKSNPRDDTFHLKQVSPSYWHSWTLGHATTQMGNSHTPALMPGSINAEGSFSLANVQEGDGLRLTNLNLNPLEVDFLELAIRHTPSPSPGNIMVFWRGVSHTPALKPGCIEEQDDNWASIKTSKAHSTTFQTLRIRLSHYWRWYSTGRIAELFIKLFPCERLEVKNIRLISAETIAPTIKVLNSKSSTAGVNHIPPNGIQAFIDGQKVQGTHFVELEISKPNFFFDDCPEASGQARALMSKLSFSQPSATISLNPAIFSGTGYFQLRVHCLDNLRRPIGEYSDSITLENSPPQVR